MNDRRKDMEAMINDLYTEAWADGWKAGHEAGVRAAGCAQKGDTLREPRDGGGTESERPGQDEKLRPGGPLTGPDLSTSENCSPAGGTQEGERRELHGTAFLDGDNFCPEGDQPSWIFVPACPHDTDEPDDDHLSATLTLHGVSDPQGEG